MEDREVTIGMFEDHMYDTAEQIKQCLNCDKPECTNCLWWED